MKTFLLILVGLVIGAVLVFGAMAAGFFDPPVQKKPGPDTVTPEKPEQPKTDKPAPAGNEWGTFSGEPEVVLLDDGRKLRLTKQFIYTDPRGKLWTAPKNWEVDGATIPPLFWSIVGGPLEGQYRNASIVHDVECDRKTESSDDVHLMFYEACRCGGISKIKAKILYIAVYRFGPRWDVVMETRIATAAKPDGTEYFVNVVERIPRMRPATLPKKEDVEAIKNYVEQNDPSIEELRETFPPATIQALDPEPGFAPPDPKFEKPFPKLDAPPPPSP